MPKYIPHELLEDLGACREERAVLRARYPQGIPVTLAAGRWVDKVSSTMWVTDRLRRRSFELYCSLYGFCTEGSGGWGHTLWGPCPACDAFNEAEAIALYITLDSLEDPGDKKHWRET